jgi:hypothetical protein
MCVKPILIDLRDTNMKTKRQESSKLPRFVVGALATAGASAANGATVQITFDNTSPGNYVSVADQFVNFDGELTGEGWVGGPLSPTINGNYINLYILTHVAFLSLSVYGNNNKGFAKLTAQYNANNTITVEKLVPFKFADSRLNGGADRLGWLHVELTGAKNSLAATREIEIKRLIFDDTLLTAPAVGTYADAAYNEMVFSAVPEPGSNLALLALGAGGLTLRRRLKRAA